MGVAPNFDYFCYCSVISVESFSVCAVVVIAEVVFFLVYAERNDALPQAAAAANVVVDLALAMRIL